MPETIEMRMKGMITFPDRKIFTYEVERDFCRLNIEQNNIPLFFGQEILTHHCLRWIWNGLFVPALAQIDPQYHKKILDVLVPFFMMIEPLREDRIAIQISTMLINKSNPSDPYPERGTWHG